MTLHTHSVTAIIPQILYLVISTGGRARLVAARSHNRALRVVQQQALWRCVAC